MPDLNCPTQNDSLANRLASNRHCVFRSGRSWFSIPAVSVREVLVVPKTVKLPESPAWLLGVAHIQSEFIPIISLQRLLDLSQVTSSDSQDRLLVMSGSPVWALQVCQVFALKDVEATLSPDSHYSSGRTSCTVGTFLFREEIASVLEPHRILQQIQQSLRECWKQTHPVGWQAISSTDAAAHDYQSTAN
jgi:chemotaxis signal transduction protein